MNKKNEFMDQMVNNNLLAWILICMLRTYRTYNSTMKFLIYEFNYKLLNSAIFLKVTLGVTLNNIIPLNIF